MLWEVLQTQDGSDREPKRDDIYVPRRVHLSRLILRSTKMSLVRMGIILLLALICFSAFRTASPRALAASGQTTPPYAGHSWYMSDLSKEAMQTLGQNEAQWANANCNVNGGGRYDTVILDFGQPDSNSTGDTWNGYGVDDFNSNQGYPFVSDAQIFSALQQYSSAWYNSATSCPRLHLILGVSNNNECPNQSTTPCDIATAGQSWANLVNAVNTWLQGTGTSWQMIAYGGDDIETEWDSASLTRAFVDGYNANTSSQFFDFGDASQHSGWTDQDIYYVAWGAGHDVALPEIYFTDRGMINRWLHVKKEHPDMRFIGVTTDCSNGFSTSDMTCVVNNTVEYAPAGAWSQLWNTLNNSGNGQPWLAYTTNFQYQPVG